MTGGGEHPLDTKRLIRRLALFTAGFFALAALLFWIVREDWARTSVTTTAPSRGTVLEELAPGREIRQSFTVAVDELQALWLDASVWDAPAGSTVRLRLTDAGDAAVAELQADAQSLRTDSLTELRLPVPVRDLRGRELTLSLTAEGGLSFWSGTSVNAGRFSAQVEELGRLTVDGQDREGSLVLRQQGLRWLGGTRWFWPVAAVLWALVCGGIADTERRRAAGLESPVLRAEDVWHRYSYLIRTLVTRDFRVKYKASVLGVLWSFLNPLLMTLVYYFVFNTLFHSDIENFVAYLMSGIIVFNYFGDATNLGLNAIVGNAALITKVYMPKFIYPLSKVLSAAVNLVISLIPLMGVMLLSGVVPHKSMLLLPLALFFLLVFCTGMALLLSSMMVFFRDIQFLWGVMLTVLNFLTPIFYPESIIPAAFRTLYHCNPLYQLIYFLRTITIGGVSPVPMSYLYCILASFGTLAVGWLVFRRTQDRFVLYL